MSANNYIGTVLGNYRIVAQVGGGAFGNVYRAEHLHLAHRVVAIKILHMAHLASEGDRERFIKEARLLEKLTHPHILPILDVGHSEDFPYIITAYAPNGSLRDRLRRIYPQRLPMEKTVRALSQVGEAISFAHMQNVIHGDIKPANILFDEKGDALLADLGIATTLASASINNINEMSGSAPYMAPEQFQGRISKECDQYALGCIAYEMFTGHQPFNAPDFTSMAFKHMTEMPPSPLEYNPDIPPYIEQAILKSIAKDPANRHPSVQAFVQALQPNVDTDKTVLASYRSSANPPGIPPGNQASEYQTILASDSDATQKVGMTGEYLTPPPVTPIAPVTPVTPIPFYRQQTGGTPPVPPGNSGPIYRQQTGGTPPVPPGNSGPIHWQPTGDTPPVPPDNSGPIHWQPTGDTPPVPPDNMRPMTPSQEAFRFAAVQPPQEQNIDKRKKRLPILLIALLAALVLILISAFYTFAYPATARVSLGPSYKDVQGTFTITSVAANPDATKNQVSGVRILSSVQSQQQSTPATGSVSTSGANASGLLFIQNNSSCDLSAPVGYSATDGNGITVATTQAAQIPIGQTVSVPAYAVAVGSAGNIPANDISGHPSIPANCSGSASVYNDAFSGGQDAGTYTTVQQSDIDNAAKPLITTLTQQANTDLQGQVTSSEQLIGTSQCTHKTQSDQNAGAKATTFNVTVTVTCTELAYGSQAAQTMAATMLKGQAQSAPGPHFGLVGQIITTLGTPKVVDAAKGIIAQDITAEGIWAYAFTSAEKQHLADVIEGKTVQDAVNLLLTQNGVRTAHIDLSGTFLFWNKMPTKLNNISFVTSNAGIPVLSATSTHPTGTPTP